MRLPLVALCLTAAAGALAPAAEPEGLAYYVAPTGRDTWSGTRPEAAADGTDGPFATLERARAAVRTQAAAARQPGNVTVCLRAGTYPLTATFELGPADSGAPGRPVTYRAFADEPARLVGGTRIPPAAFVPVTDPAVLDRLPAEARGQMRVADLPRLGITDYGRLRPRGFSRPYVSPGLELFVAGQPLPLARWPNDGSVRLGEVLDPGSVPREGDDANRGGTFAYDTDRPDRWRQADDVWLTGLFHYGFADDTLPVRTIDPATRTITLGEAHTYGLASGQPWQAWYALNLLEEIDRPGEWFLDRRTGRLYLWPPDGFATAEVWVSRLEGPVLALENASHIVLRGLTVEFGRGLGVYVEGGTANQLLGCTFRNLGTVAVCFGQGARPDPSGLGSWRLVLPAEKGENVDATPIARDPGDLLQYLYANSAWDRRAGTGHRVIGCDIYNTGAGGIILGGGDRRTLTPGDNEVVNCHIHDVNRLDRAYRAPVNIDGVGNRVANCLIHDAPHCAILLHGNDHVIEFNEVHHVCQLADDMGAFYMGRDPSEQGNVLRHNLWHHIGSGKGGSTCAVYLDDGSCGTTVTGNVFVRNRGTTVWINGGHDHLFENNLFVDSGAAIGAGMDNRQWCDWVRSPLQALRLRRAVDVTQPPYATHYPRLADLFDDNPDLRRGNTVLHNLAVRSGDFGGGRNDVRDNLAVGEDPGFIDPQAMDFALRADAPVLAKAPWFAPIPFGRIGLYTDEYRRSVPPRSALPGRPTRDPQQRRFAVDVAALAAAELAGQAGWESFGPGPDLLVGPGARTGPFDPGPVALANGRDSWATLAHGLVLDPQRPLTVEIEAFLPAPLPPDAFFELYLNRAATWDNPSMGPALVGGAQDNLPATVGARQTAAGPRVLASERLEPGHWYRVRLHVAPGQQAGRLWLQDLTAADPEPRPCTFAAGPAADLTPAGAWSPAWPELDALVLRLGGGAQVRRLALTNE